MKKEKLAIVSSYDELCGNASYTKAIADELAQYYDVTVVGLNVELLRKGEGSSGKDHVQEICEKLRSFDCVNIQFEAGLFGSDLSLIYKRFMSIAKASKRLVLTMHRYHGREKYPNFKKIIKSFVEKRARLCFQEIKFSYMINRYVPLYDKLISYCKSTKSPIIVHTIRDCELIKCRFNYDFVYAHPLCFYSQKHIQSIKERYSRTEFCKKHGLDVSKKYIGIFGFINKYKGHETLIKALKYLPKQYELLIFGAQHPHTIKVEEVINPYINELLKLIHCETLTDRIRFCGTLNDDDFLRALIFCDYNVLPYMEVMQGGSAVAALSLEAGAKNIFSHNYAFFELARYAPNCFKTVTMGNYLELSQAIAAYRESDYGHHVKNYRSKYNIHTNARLYRQLLSGITEMDLNQEKELQESCKFEHAHST
ncbi:MAG TPA: glycosyltransferase [Rhabdochlamydiaceae bacterium]|jgi:glycosyltransferase involved in cell wall biosynthesis|nr:glycosyltransferase [Rhabdochlamydiaceae bacterium]